MARPYLILPDEYLRDFTFLRVTGPRFTLSFDPLRQWLDDESRPGIYAWGQHWLAREGNLSPRDCIEVMITDPQVAFEFKMRWM